MGDNDFEIKDGVLVKYNGVGGDVVIPEGVTKIGDCAFRASGIQLRKCEDIKSITIPKGVTGIGWSAFGGCAGLTNIIIPEGITKIEKYVFAKCESLVGIQIPKKVKEIENCAFEGCISLINIAIPENLTKIDPTAFSDCSSLMDIFVDDKNKKFISVEGVLYNKAKTELLICPGGKSGNLTIPGGVIKVGRNAFSRSKLTSITIPDGVTHIGDFVFAHTNNLKSLIIPDSLTKIGKNIFWQSKDEITVTVVGESDKKDGWTGVWKDRKVKWEVKTKRG
jgi:hypothetical protein